MHPLNSFADLDFVVPESITREQDIPKTWIYVDNVKEGEKIVDHLTELISARNSALPNGHNVVRPYNAHLPTEYRTAAMDAFRKGDIRILVCTEAAGMVRTVTIRHQRHAY